MTILFIVFTHYAWSMIEYFLEFPVVAKTIVEPVDFPCMQLNQVHGNKVVVVDKTTPSFLEADAMITQELDVPLVIRHADCQVAIVYDPVNHALGIAHAGWRGQTLSIYTMMVNQMKTAFKSDPKTLHVVFSPSLGPTKSEFKNYQTELPEWMWSYQQAPFHFNLWGIAKAEFISCGLLEERIQLPTLCTYLDSRFHSYRRTKTAQRNHTYGILSSSKLKLKGEKCSFSTDDKVSQ